MTLSRPFALLAALFALLLWASAAPAQMPSLSLGTSTEAAATADEPSLDELIRILENDDTRARLIESLKAAAYRAPAAEAADPVAEAAALTLPGRIAVYSSALIGSLGETWSHLQDSGLASLDMLSGVGRINIPRIFDAVAPVGLVALVVFLILAIGRFAKTPMFRRLARGAEHAGPLRKLALLVAAGLADALSILLCWAGGYLAATIFNGGRPGINQALFLNAFLLIETIKVAVAAFVSPRYPELRLTPFSDRQARYWYFWISRLISILGYTFLFVAPIVQQASSEAAADAVRFVVVLLTLGLTIGLILRNRSVVRERLKRAKHRGDKSFGARVNAFLGQIWWLLAIGFALTVFVVWLRSPDTGLTFLASATLKSIAAMAIGGLIVSVLSRVIASGIPIPQAAKDRLPLLEKRVNSFIPNALTVIRVIVVLIVIAYIFEAWSLLSVSSWLATSLGQLFVGSLLGAAIVLVLGVGVYIAVSSWVEYRLNPHYGTVPTARERTLLSLFRNAFTIAMVVIVAMLVLSQLGINIAPLLAGAGVVGLAIGFGAQKFVQDIITGAFIQIQNAMNEGDIVEVNGISGVVEHLTVRSVGLRTVEGTWYLIPFSSVDQVANFSKDFAYYVADIGVAYRENVADVKQMMHDAFDELKLGSEGENLISEFDMWGVNELGDSAVVVRGRVMTKPGTQWGIGRAYREIVKRMADERGIEIPFPQTTVWFGEDRKGRAPPVRVEALDAPAGGRPVASLPPAAAPSEPGAQDGASQHGSVDAGGKPIPPGASDIDSAGDGRG
ncbi:mechanosensitive ion channel domain-containing protein [Aurantimonas sp. HBX-1]|uniref:mechanosensitive ion channel domain-containing protein n=1 Tax=Aurantimonas sp. HBX-1 TaxID=2906072 RepID=UPI001F38D8AB|nr:mechanosensitive ion channel domain-containing protein [Aurantimonas sp. HBX-1]UIJ73601.1 mechanosensitive ion channel [Aurantimonas sp. HBX-1]